MKTLFDLNQKGKLYTVFACRRPTSQQQTDTTGWKHTVSYKKYNNIKQKDLKSSSFASLTQTVNKYIFRRTTH